MQTKNNKIINKIHKFIKQKFYKGKFDENTNLFETGVINSFGMVELILFCEEEFKTDISNVDFYNDINSIKKIANYIDVKKKS